MTSIVYNKIETVIVRAGKPLAAHEFDEVSVDGTWGRKYIGCSEATLARRMREMREIGRLKSQRREGKPFVEYSIALLRETADENRGGGSCLV